MPMKRHELRCICDLANDGDNDNDDYGMHVIKAHVIDVFKQKANPRYVCMSLKPMLKQASLPNEL